MRDILTHEQESDLCRQLGTTPETLHGLAYAVAHGGRVLPGDPFGGVSRPYVDDHGDVTEDGADIIERAREAGW